MILFGERSEWKWRIPLFLLAVAVIMVNMYYSKCKPIQEVETLESYFRKYDELQNEFDELDREFTTLIPGHLEYFLDFSNPELFEGMEEGQLENTKGFYWKDTAIWFQ